MRYAIDKARSYSCPKENIERSVKKASGELGGENFEEVLYEAYGPGGVAVMCSALTDNRNRTAGELRKAFEVCGGNLGATGCVGYMFAFKGVLVVEAKFANEDALMEIALEAGAFGGNPLACAAGNAVMDVVMAPGFLEEVERKGRKLRGELDMIAREFPTVFVDARGMGLLLGLKAAIPVGQIQAACVAEGLMAITAGDNVLRLAPPLVVTDNDIDQAVVMLRKAATKVAAGIAEKAAAQ